MAQLYSSNRFVLYRQIKQQPALEMYLTVLDKRVFRDVYIKFRLGMSELYSHQYRFREDPPSMLCPSCKEDDEDDAHFLLECPAYEDLRSRYIRFAINPMTLNYVSLLASCDVEIIRAVSIYLYFAFKRRKYATNLQTLENEWE